MKFNFKLIIFALGFAILIESFLYAAFPETVKKALSFLQSLSAKEIRLIGIVGLFIGALLIVFWRLIN